VLEGGPSGIEVGRRIPRRPRAKGADHRPDHGRRGNWPIPPFGCRGTTGDVVVQEERGGILMARRRSALPRGRKRPYRGGRRRGYGRRRTASEISTSTDEVTAKQVILGPAMDLRSRPGLARQCKIPAGRRLVQTVNRNRGYGEFPISYRGEARGMIRRLPRFRGRASSRAARPRVRW